ncbi:hypothetical protein UF75_5434 [Desulfosporosinus sp. I2]|nr:hypothetical protein UF75_5434 [Desulfosporosinus sp. I2]
MRKQGHTDTPHSATNIVAGHVMPDGYIYMKPLRVLQS